MATGRDFNNKVDVDVTVNPPGAPAPARVSAADRRRARLLKFNCDRAAQRRIFVSTLKKALRTKSSWPQVVVTIGRDCDCVDNLVERLHSLELPRVLGAAGLGTEIMEILPEWPPGDPDRGAANGFEDQVQELQESVGDALGFGNAPSKSEIARALSNRDRALVFSFSIDGESYDDRRHQELVQALDWWKGLSREISTPYPVVVMPWFVTSRRILPFQRFGRDQSKSVHSRLQKLERSAAYRDRLTVLPTLGTITLQDARRWLSENKHYADEQPADYSKKVTSFFSWWFGSQKTVTMTEASGFFQKLIDEMEISKANVVGESAQT